MLDFFPEPVGSLQFFVVEFEEALVVLDGFNGFICEDQVLFEALDVFCLCTSVSWCPLFFGTAKIENIFELQKFFQKKSEDFPQKFRARNHRTTIAQLLGYFRTRKACTNGHAGRGEDIEKAPQGASEALLLGGGRWDSNPRHSEPQSAL